MNLDPTKDPNGVPWTAASITAYIAQLANRGAVLGRRYSDIQDSDSPSYIVDETAQQQAAASILLEMRELEDEQKQAQAIAAFIAQGNVPAVKGGTSVSVIATPPPVGAPAGTQPTLGFGTVPISQGATPNGGSGGSNAVGTQTGLGGPIPPGPSSPAGGGANTVANVGGPALNASLFDANGQGFSFAPNVPKWLVLLGVAALGLVLLSD